MNISLNDFVKKFRAERSPAAIDQTGVRAIVFVLAVMLISSAQGWETGIHEDAAINFDEQLSLHSLLLLTIKRHPQIGALTAEKITVAAEQRYSDGLLPEVMQLEAFHLNDRALSDVGAYENEVALSIPLWLPGEKRARSVLSDSMFSSAKFSEAALHWQVSAQLRQLLWNAVLAKRQWTLSMEQEERLSEVFSQVSISTEAGDLSRADQLATMQELALWKAETMTLEAAYQDAVREYRTLTGTTRVPVKFREALSTADHISEQHPATQLALARVTEASAQADFQRQSNSVRPSVQVFWRGFRGEFAGPNASALGIGLRVPMGRSSRKATVVAHAEESVANSHADYLSTQRQLELQLHEARHFLYTSREKLRNSNALMTAAAERQELDELAFELGETSTREWLRQLSRMKEIERSHEYLLLQEGAAIAALNQALGESL